VRVDDGWIVHIPNRKSVFYRDDIVADYSGGAGMLKITSKNISSIYEVIDWFSDTELEMVRFLDLSNNNIAEIKGLSQFPNLIELNLSNNNIQILDNCGQFNYLKKINLSDNPLNKINNFFDVLPNSDEKTIILDNVQIQDINEIVYNKIVVFTNGKLIISSNCQYVEKIAKEIFNYYELNPIKEEKTTSLSINTKIDLHALSWDSKGEINYFKEFSSSLVKCDKCEKKITHRTKLDNKGLCSQCKGACFIATATMGSYDHPEVMLLRNFRDNWILEKSWGEAFVKFYYHYGAIAAKSIEKSFILKKICYLLIVKPVVFLSRFLK
jgi:hypothetical protein